MSIPYLRTPDVCFENLPNYSFAPNYALLHDGLRMHYVDENKQQSQVIVLLHGEPSWSYLYRKMIPVLAAAGYRVIAPDLIGFGKSDKPTHAAHYTYAEHVKWVQELLTEHLSLSAFHLFMQDWGGLIGLRIVAAIPEKISSVAIANTGLPTGHEKVPEAFFQWRNLSQQLNPFPVSKIISMGVINALSPEELAAYDAPFPDENYKTGAKVFPLLVPVTPDDVASAANIAAWKILKEFSKPFLTLFSDSDPITSGGEKIWQQKIAGCKHQHHEIIQNAGHFLQEDKGEEIAAKIILFHQHTLKIAEQKIL